MRKTSLLSRITAASFHHPWRFLLSALSLAAVGTWLASGLEIRSSLEELLPSNYSSVRHAKELVKRIGGDGTVYVIVETLDGPENLPRVEALALKLVDEYRALGPEVVRAVEASMRPIANWYADHWPLFAELSDLSKARDELVAAIGKAKAQANPLFSGLEDEDIDNQPITITSKEPLLDPEQASPRRQVENRFDRFVDGFMVSGDRRSLTLVIRPAGTSLGIDGARELMVKMRAVAEAHRSELDAQRLRVGFAGSFPNYLAEYDAITSDILSTFLAVMVLLLLSILIFYRQVRPVLAIGAVLLSAIAVTFGITRLAIGYLNTETVFLSSIVAGNGINYGIVYLARVVQLRRRGIPMDEACQAGAQAALTGTLLASLGTAVSFSTLIVAANRGFRHFGFIGGMGMLICWAATFLLTPAVMAFFERIWPSRPHERQMVEHHPRWLEVIFAQPRIMILGFVLLGVTAFGYFAWRLPTLLERNLENLGNDPIGSTELKRNQAQANESLGSSSAGVVALLPTPEAAEEYCRAIRQRHESPRIAELIDGCETAATVVPLQQAEKLKIITDIRERLTDRVIARLPAKQAVRAREIRADLAAQRAVRVEDAPPSLLDRFRERDGTVGRVAFVRAKHSAKLELGPNLRDFVAAVRNVPVGGQTFDAAGETVVAADLFENIEREGPLTTLYSFLGVCALVLVFFRSIPVSAKLLSSLTIGVVFMGTTATLLGVKINFLNFIVYPITFGIAVDYGANVLSRMNLRRSVLPALAEVGGAVFLCSWTTIIGYGALLFSINRALRSFGWYAMLGELTTLVTALALLPALMLVFRPRQWASGEGAGLPAVQIAGPPIPSQETTDGD